VRAREALRATGFPQLARHAGELAPDASLVDARGRVVRLSDFWRERPLVVLFYRGEWCGACMRQLRAWEAHATALRQAGARLVAISPEGGDRLRSTIRRQELSFVLTSDPALDVASRFGVALSVPPEVVDLYAYLGADPAVLDVTGHWLQPVPATFLVGTDGTILFSRVDLDGRERTPPAEVLKAIPRCTEDGLQA